MAKASPALTSHNAGEFGPTLAGRTDLAKYPSGNKRSENFLMLVQGPAQRRGGFRLVQAVKDSTKRTWAVEFEFSVTQTLLLEFGDRYLRFYADHGPLLVTDVVAWDNGTDYVIGDLASRLGVNYYCIADHTNQQPPDATYWYALEEDIYEIPTIYPLSHLTNEEGSFALDFEQSADVLYIAGGFNHPPMTLTRFDTTRWVFAEHDAKNGPFMDQNKLDTKVMWASAKTGTITLKTNFNCFRATDVGRLVRLQSQDVDVPPWSPDSRAEVELGELRRYNGRTYRALTEHETGTSPPLHEEGIASDGKDFSEDDDDLGVYWEYQDAGYGIARITAYTNQKQVTATVLMQMPENVVGIEATVSAISQADPGVVTTAADHGFGEISRTVTFFGVGGMSELNGKFFRTLDAAADEFSLLLTDTTGYAAFTAGGTVVMNASKRWSLGAWSITSGYPTTVTFAYERLCWARGIDYWLSVTGDYADMSADFAGLVTPACAITRKLTAQQVNNILWMIEADRLLIGTAGGEFAVGPITSVDPLGPENIQCKRQSKKRCRSDKPLLVDTSVVYTQRAGQRLLRLDYSFEIDRFASANMNALAPHIARNVIVDKAFQQEPDPIIWCVTGAGELIGFTLDQEQDVLGWHRHPVGGNGFVEWVKCKPSPTGDRDEVWIQVRRTINGQVYRSIEFAEKPWESGDDRKEVFYMDCGLTYRGPAISVVEGLEHLEGEWVQVVVNGAAHPLRRVIGAQIALAESANVTPTDNVIHVGLACDARLVKMRLEVGSDDGTSQGKIKRIQGATLRLVDSLGGKCGMEGKQLTEIQYRKPSMPMDQPPEIYTGDKDVGFHGDYEQAGCIEYLNDQPFPTTLVAIYPRLVTADAPK